MPSLTASLASGAIGSIPALAVYATPDVVTTVADVLAVQPQMVGALAVSGAAGAFVRAVYMPEPGFARRIMQGAAGALCAIFVGGIVGHMLDAATGGGTYAFLAAGFFMGEGGLATLHAIRDRVIGDRKR